MPGTESFYNVTEFYQKELKKIELTEVKDEYLNEVKQILSYSNYGEFSMNLIHWFTYSAPGSLRLKDPKLVPTETRKYILYKAPMIATGASAGKVKGTVIKAITIAETRRKMKKVENPILVTSRTNTYWTPLFSKIKGLIVETGGMLSHAAIVSREYKLPCVIGVDIEKLEDRMEIEIDGTTGEVKIIG